MNLVTKESTQLIAFSKGVSKIDIPFAILLRFLFFAFRNLEDANYYVKTMLGQISLPDVMFELAARLAILYCPPYDGSFHTCTNLRI